MSGKQFLLHNPDSREAAKAYIDGLHPRRRYSMTIETWLPPANPSQRGLYFKWVGVMAPHFGYSKDELHEELKRCYLGLEEHESRVTGEVTTRIKSTKSLKTKAAWNEFMTQVQVLADQHEIKLPQPDDPDSWGPNNRRNDDETESDAEVLAHEQRPRDGGGGSRRAAQ